MVHYKEIQSLKETLTNDADFGKKIRPLLDGINRFESIYKSEYFEYQKKAEQAVQALTDPYK